MASVSFLTEKSHLVLYSHSRQKYTEHLNPYHVEVCRHGNISKKLNIWLSPCSQHNEHQMKHCTLMQCSRADAKHRRCEMNDTFKTQIKWEQLLLLSVKTQMQESNSTSDRNTVIRNFTWQYTGLKLTYICCKRKHLESCR